MRTFEHEEPPCRQALRLNQLPALPVILQHLAVRVCLRCGTMLNNACADFTAINSLAPTRSAVYANRAAACYAIWVGNSRQELLHASAAKQTRHRQEPTRSRCHNAAALGQGHGVGKGQGRGWPVRTSMLRKTLRESGRARIANTFCGGRSTFAASRTVQKKPSLAWRGRQDSGRVSGMPALPEPAIGDGTMDVKRRSLDDLEGHTV